VERSIGISRGGNGEISIAGRKAGEPIGDGAGDEVGVRSASSEVRGGARRPDENIDEYSAARRVWKVDMLWNAGLVNVCVLAASKKE
jgi:hypothetical protein